MEHLSSRAATCRAAKGVFLAQPSLNEFSINHVATCWLLLLAIDCNTTNSSKPKPAKKNRASMRRAKTVRAQDDQDPKSTSGNMRCAKFIQGGLPKGCSESRAQLVVKLALLSPTSPQLVVLTVPFRGIRDRGINKLS